MKHLFFVRNKAGLAIILASFFNIALASSERRTTATMADVEKVVYEKGAHYGTSSVVVIFDLDNTLLAQNQALGSDQWFAWQSGMLKSDDKTGLVANTFGELLDVQGRLFALSHMHPLEQDTPQIVSRIQEAGYKSIILTARGPGFRNATERELRKNGLNFSKSAMGSAVPAAYLPIPKDDLDGFTEEEVGAFKLRPARLVSYMDGVYMVEGQHKGAMLRALLQKTQSAVTAIVFIDDQKKHCDAVQAAFSNRTEDVIVFEYTRDHAAMEAFQKGDKAGVIADYDRLSNVISDVFPVAVTQ